jgi:hypothetical protein
LIFVMAAAGLKPCLSKANQADLQRVFPSGGLCLTIS